jgi:hypothetical protein
VSVAPALLAPLVVQAIAMGFDELHFHRKRGLGRWERVGHPLDTMTMLACVGWVLVADPTERNVVLYAGLAAVSCLFITKDEFVHARRCSPGEHWLHALLFVAHPLTLVSVGLLWPVLHSPHDRSLWQFVGRPVFGVGGLSERGPPAKNWLVTPITASGGGAAAIAGAAGFCFYQAVYWNVPWLRRAPPIP